MQLQIIRNKLPEAMRHVNAVASYSQLGAAHSQLGNRGISGLYGCFAPPAAVSVTVMRDSEPRLGMTAPLIAGAIPIRTATQSLLFAREVHLRKISWQSPIAPTEDEDCDCAVRGMTAAPEHNLSTTAEAPISEPGLT
jgi:hypothetical protein